MKKNDKPMIIAIGGMGGSGTRAVAEVLIQAGIYMGDLLNPANDNLLFTRLFKNPTWCKKATEIQKKKRLRLFINYMSDNSLTWREFFLLSVATRTNPLLKSPSKFYVRMLKKIGKTRMHRESWGWKEPNTQMYAIDFLNSIDELKYIHVIRHGLDMAFSKNKQQLQNWGWQYGITLNGTESEEEVAVKQLDFWLASTKMAFDLAKKYPNRVFLLNHTTFCEQPKSQIDALFSFLSYPVADTQKELLYRIPSNTGSNKRYKEKDIHIFAPEKRKAVKEFGFII